MQVFGHLNHTPTNFEWVKKEHKSIKIDQNSLTND